MDTAHRPDWRTSSYTDNGASCVEVAPIPDAVLVRDTKDHGTGPVVEFSPEQWAALVRDVRPGLDGTAAVTTVELRTVHDGVEVHTRWHLHAPRGDVVLHFTDAEWEAFVAGARDGEFDFAGASSLLTA